MCEHKPYFFFDDYECLNIVLPCPQCRIEELEEQIRILETALSQAH